MGLKLSEEMGRTEGNIFHFKFELQMPDEGMHRWKMLLKYYKKKNLMPFFFLFKHARWIHCEMHMSAQ